MTQTLNKKNLHQVVDHLLEQHRGRIAIEQNGRSCSYDELDARSNSLCAALRAQGVSRGDVVALPAVLAGRPGAFRRRQGGGRGKKCSSPGGF